MWQMDVEFPSHSASLLAARPYIPQDTSGHGRVILLVLTGPSGMELLDAACVVQAWDLDSHWANGLNQHLS